MGSNPIFFCENFFSKNQNVPPLEHFLLKGSTALKRLTTKLFKFDISKMGHRHPVCKCVLINAMSLIIQLSSKKTIVIKLFRLIMLIIYVFFCVITYYSFFLFCYLPSKFLLIKGMVRFINIFNMHIPFAWFISE